MLTRTIKSNQFSHTIVILKGDIIQQTTDAIVNAANQDLILGAGVAGAIRKHGGIQIQQECNEIGRIDIGKAVITTGGHLKSNYVIHAVGPIYTNHSPDDAEKLLSNAIINSLHVLEEYNLSSITFPAISTGIYGFPKNIAANVMISAIMKYLTNAQNELTIQICLFSLNDYNLFRDIAEKMIIQSK